MTQEQNEQIFVIMRQKAEDEKLATARRFELELEVMRRESEARIAANAAAATAATVVAQALKRAGMEENDTIDGVLPEVRNISLCFAGLPQEETVRIFYNRFKAINLYRLRHGGSATGAPLRGLPGPGKNRH